ERAWREQRRDLDVVGVEPEAGEVLAQAATLHVQRDHVHRRGRRDACVDRREQEGLRAATGSARRADAIARDHRERLEKIDRTDAVPQLQAREVQSAQVLTPAAELTIVIRVTGIVLLR